MKFLRLIGLILVVFLLVLGVKFYDYFQKHFVYHVPESILEKRNLDEIDLSEVLNLIRVMEYNRPRISIKDLEILSERVDSLGYFANIALSRRFPKDDPKVEGFYLRALELYPSDQARYGLAEYYYRQELFPSAILQYKELLPQETALKQLQKLGVSLEEILDVLYEKKDWLNIQRLYREFVGDSENKGETSLKKIYAMSLGTIGEYQRALPIFTELVSEIPEDDDVKWWYARSLEETSYNTHKNQIKDLYAQLEEKGAYRLGLILQGEGERLSAARTFSKSFSDHSRWLGARIFEEMNMPQSALANYLENIQQESPYQDDSAYRAIILSRRLGISPPKDALEILSESPAWMRRLGRGFPLKKDVYQEIPNRDSLQLIKLYEEKNEEEYLFIELSIQAINASPEMKVAIGEIRGVQKDLHIGVTWGERALVEKSLELAYKLVYPRPFMEYVLISAKEFNVDPYLIWAVMKVESDYRPLSVSRAGAVGLLQIMPDTAKEISRALNQTMRNEDLKEPQTNIRFGSYYISFLQGIYKGNLDKVLASYNAGLGTVSSWEKSVIGRREEDFPTAITFFETREYITKVMNAYLIYKWIYDNNSDPQE